MERYVDARECDFKTAFRAPTSREAVEALLRSYVDVVTDPSHAPGCLVVNSSPSLAASDALRAWLSQHREALRIRLAKRFAEDPANVGLDPGSMARLVTTLAGGLAVEAGTGATREELYDAVAVGLTGFPARPGKAARRTKRG